MRGSKSRTEMEMGIKKPNNSETLRQNMAKKVDKIKELSIIVENELKRSLYYDKKEKFKIVNG